MNPRTDPIVQTVTDLAVPDLPRDPDGRVTVMLTRAQLESWAGRPLTDHEVARLDNAIPHSSIPDAVGEISASFSDYARVVAETWNANRGL